MTERMTIEDLRKAERGSVRFTVYGKPIPMARPRVCRLPNGQSRTFNPASSTAWKQSIALQALEHRPAQLLDGPLVLTVVFYLLKPKSAPKRVTHAATKPDWDNLAKAVTDALEGLIYTNDSRIVSAHIDKMYGDPPRVEIEIREHVPASAVGTVRRVLEGSE